GENGEARGEQPGEHAGEQSGEQAGQLARPLQLSITPADQATGVSPVEPVRVTATEGTLTEVAMTNPANKLVAGELGGDRKSWTSGEPLGYGRTYKIVVTGSGPDGEATTVTSSFTTLQPRAVTFASMNPLQGQVVGVGQPIAVYFDEPIGNKELAEQSISISTTPRVEGAFYWFSDREVHWRPQEFWRAGTQVVADIRIYGRDLGNGVYGEQDRRISFSVGDAVVAEADGASHKMVVKINGVVAREMPVSLGKPAAPSSDGVHVVTELHPKKLMDSSTYGVPVDSPEGYRTEVEWAVRISNGGEFVHSAPWSVRDQGRRNVSHGCINASPENAKWFFDTVKKGDVVIIRNSGGPVLKSWDGFGDWQIPWPQWQAGGNR
ncbi:MAG TPA: Ig-like domain-containing protein, partial [Pseudonocardiaceae bacterium]|nr:Ig-like domain-containing protein [Pseudonocardiaceae bacterium]